MKNKKRTIELANLVILFNKKGLVESFNNRFFPIINDGRVRGKGEVSSYRFYNLTVDKIDKTPVLYGQLLKFMDIEAEQDFNEDEDRLIDSSGRLHSVPSSFFLIDLTTHRLSYLGETRRSPTLRDFEYCLKNLLMAEWKKQRSNLKEKLKKEKKKKRLNKDLKKEIEEKIDKILPIPEIRVTPLPAIKKLKATLDPFQIVTQVILKPLPRNNELSDQNARFLRNLEQQQERIKAKNASVNISNTKDGLQKEEVKKLVKATASGNYDVKVKGKDSKGTDIDSDLRDINVKFKEIVPARESDKSRAKRLLDKLKEAFQRGFALAVKPKAETISEANKIVSEFNKS